MADDADTRLAKLKQRRASYDDKIRRLEKAAREKARKEDTRRKILVGAVVLLAAEDDPDKEVWLARLLDQELTRVDDRALFGLAAKEGC
jgi:hypothetical protein